MNTDDTLRKSTPTPAQRGNVRKADTYREAFTRIELAMDDGYFLEAVAILESIIADRIASYLAVAGCLPAGPQPSLERLLAAWRGCEEERSYALRRRTPQGLAVERTYDDLAEAVDTWRLRVDEALHTFVASPRGTPTAPVESLLASVRDDAREGRTLCDAVIGWHRSRTRPLRGAGAEEHDDDDADAPEELPPPAPPPSPEPPLGAVEAPPPVEPPH